MGSKTVQTAISENGGKKPKWFQTFLFSAENHNLAIVVKDSASFFNDSEIGSGYVNLKEF